MLNDEKYTFLWSSFKEGNWDSYTSLYNEFFKSLNNYGHKFTQDSDLVEDSVQDLYIRLWNSKANLGYPASVRNYLYKSLRSIIFRKLQTQSRFTGITEEDDQYNFEISYDQHYINNESERELKNKLKAVIQTLPSRQREIVYLRFYEGLGYDEIADIMNIHVSS